MVNESEYITVEEAAKRIGYSDSRVRQMLRAGKLKGERTPDGRKWLIPKAEFFRFLGKSGADIDIVRELESVTMTIGNEEVSMAWLFWALSDLFVRGLAEEDIVPALASRLPQGDAASWSQAQFQLVTELRLKGVVGDQTRHYGIRANTAMVITSSGAGVVRQLKTKNWPKP